MSSSTIFQPDAETMSTDERRRLQQTRLVGLVDRLLAADGPQAAALSSAGVTDGSEVDLDGLALLPTTTKADLWAGYPFGHVAVDADELATVHGSSGTGGRPTLVGYTDADLAVWGEVCARSLGCAGATPTSSVHNAYGYGLFTGGLGMHYGARTLGATVIPVSGGMTERQLRLLADVGSDILCCTPSYAVYLGEALAAAGADAPNLSGLRAGLFGAEPWTDSLRQRIEELLGVVALDIYGLSEVTGPGVATECLEAQDGLHVNEDHFLVEALEPGSPSQVPDGSPGELTFTTLTKTGMPLLRYRTGDVASLHRGPCACGRTLIRMSKVSGRIDDMLVLRGVNVYPSEIESVLLADERLGPHYQLVVDRRGSLVKAALLCESPDSPSLIADELIEALRQRLGIHLDVHVLDPETLPRWEVGKAQRVVQWTDGPAPFAVLEGA